MLLQHSVKQFVGRAVEGVLVRGVLVPAVLIVGLYEEACPQRLGIYHSATERCALRVLVISLVYNFIALLCSLKVIDAGQRLVESMHVVIAEAVSEIGRDSSSRLSQPLSEEEETACAPVVIKTVS